MLQEVPVSVGLVPKVAWMQIAWFANVIEQAALPEEGQAAMEK
jgi:hypothetical protein